MNLTVFAYALPTSALNAAWSFVTHLPVPQAERDALLGAIRPRMPLPPTLVPAAAAMARGEPVEADPTLAEVAEWFNSLQDVYGDHRERARASVKVRARLERADEIEGATAARSRSFIDALTVHCWALRDEHVGHALHLLRRGPAAALVPDLRAVLIDALVTRDVVEVEDAAMLDAAHGRPCGPISDAADAALGWFAALLRVISAHATTKFKH